MVFESIPVYSKPKSQIIELFDSHWVINLKLKVLATSWSVWSLSSILVARRKNLQFIIQIGHKKKPYLASLGLFALEVIFSAPANEIYDYPDQ